MNGDAPEQDLAGLSTVCGSAGQTSPDAPEPFASGEMGAAHDEIASHAPLRRKHRPDGVTWLALGVLIMAGFQAVRLWAAIEQWALVDELLPISPVYLAVDGLVWALVGLALAVGLWFGQGWAYPLSLLAGPLYAGARWIDLLALTPNGAAAANLPFNAALTGIGLALWFWILSRRQTRLFFGRVA